MWFSFRCGHQETPMQLFTFVYLVFRSENYFRCFMVLSCFIKAKYVSYVIQQGVEGTTNPCTNTLILRGIFTWKPFEPVLTAFLYWSQVVPSVVLPYREPLSDHDSWRYFDILYFWNQKWNWWNWCKIVWLINPRGTESRAISRNGHLLQLLAAEHAEDRDIRRFHCTTDFFTEVEYWIQQSSLLAITWSYGTVILKKLSDLDVKGFSYGEFSDCDVADGLNDEDWWSFTMILQ